jgi:TPR repeat protein
MANILQQGRKPAPHQGLMLPYFVAGLIGIASAGFVGRTFEKSVAIPAMNLHQAVSVFDAGNLNAATAAFRTLANKGNPHAAYWYGHALDLGLGTPADVKAAIVQYQKAWAGGVTQAGTRLGELYLKGNAIPPDFAKARSYLTNAARRGDARAALDLGGMLRDGIGGPADPVSAYAWLEVASLRGNAQAQVERNRLLPTLTPAQQAAASQQATADLPVVAAKQATPPAKTPAPAGKA